MLFKNAAKKQKIVLVAPQIPGARRPGFFSFGLMETHHCRSAISVSDTPPSGSSYRYTITQRGCAPG